MINCSWQDTGKGKVLFNKIQQTFVCLDLVSTGWSFVRGIKGDEKDFAGGQGREGMRRDGRAGLKNKE